MIEMVKAELEIPIFPLKTVLFPSVQLQLKIFEPRYSDMIAKCMREDSPFGVVHIFSGEETDAESEIFTVGVSAKVGAWHERNDGLLGITAEGYKRFEILSTRTQDNGLVIASIIFELEDELVETPDQYHYMPELLHHITTQQGEKADKKKTPFYLMLYQLIHILPLENTLKQRLLEVPKCIDRAVILHAELIRIGVIQYVDPAKEKHLN
ncbi:MAG: LON peptidase substrate-binding domain-containing protein [Gammaproteobacteria bacterium]|nr:LON peptidase substrate-binding domain-containing protein [Gammaproteobacteria bacterium]